MEELTFELEFRPKPPPPPPTLVIRRNDGKIPIVLTEDEGFALYMTLRQHFEEDCDGTHDRADDSASGR